MRITFVLPVYLKIPIGGYRVVYEYADYLSANGHEVTIAFPRQRHATDKTFYWLEPIKKRLWGPKLRLLNRPLIPWHSLHNRIKITLVPAVQDRFMPNAEAVIATSWLTAGPVASLSAEKGKKFYLIQSHETWDGPDDEVNSTWHLPMKKIVIAKWLQRLGTELGTAELRHIPNGIDLKRFHVITPPENRKMSILSLFHEQEIKGVKDALTALRLYHERYPTVAVSMFGASPRTAAIPEWVEYHENPSQEVLIRDVYNQHSVYLGASLLEGWALPPAEAMACGCAFVGTNIGGFGDYATHNETALLSPPRDPVGLLQNLIRITDDADLRSRIQRRGTENIQQFTWQAAGRAMEAYLHENILTECI